MKILLVEPQSNDADFLIQALHRRTGASLEHAHLPKDGLLRIVNAHGAINLVVFTSQNAPSDAAGFAEALREACDAAFIRAPKMIVLVSFLTTPAVAATLQDRHIPVRLRSSVDGVCFDIAVMLSMLSTNGNRPLWRIRHSQGIYGVFVRGAVKEARICVGHEVARLARLLSGGLDAYTVEEIAERLGICRQSVKKYMRDLRLAYDAARAKAGALEPGSSVVWMQRGAGGTLCGLRAHVFWG